METEASRNENCAPPLPDGPFGPRVKPGRLLLGLLSISALLLLPLTWAADDEETQKKLVKEYNNLLDDTGSNLAESPQSAANANIQEFIRLIRCLLSQHISDPQVLQKFHFVASYGIIHSLERNPPAGLSESVSRWREALIKLDIMAYQTNRFYERPSALWAVQKAKSIPATPTKRMLEGHIEREEKAVMISSTGQTCSGSEKGCEKIRYVLLRFLVRGPDDPEAARALLHSFPAEKANPRVTGYWEELLDKETLLIRRNYTMKPLPGYEGTMENYHQLVFRDRQRIVLLEENARVGQFVLATDNAAAYILSPPYGVTVAFLFTGKYAMEGFFRALAGSKPVEEPVQAMAILRQYVEHPEKGVDCAVRAGQEDYQQNQKP